MSESQANEGDLRLTRQLANDLVVELTPQLVVSLTPELIPRVAEAVKSRWAMAHIITTGLAAGFNLLIVVLLSGWIMPSISQDIQETLRNREATLKNREVIEDNHHLLEENTRVLLEKRKDIDLLIKRLNDLATKAEKGKE